MADVSASVVRLGGSDNPAKAYAIANSTTWTYAANPWTLYPFGGKIYGGCGNSASSGSSPNKDAGSALTNDGVPIIVYDPATGLFTYEGTVSDANGRRIPQEQVNKFHSFGGQLVTGGHDDTAAGSPARWYRLESGTWVEYARMPNKVHVYDMYQFNSRWWTCGYASVDTSSLQSVADGSEGSTNWSDATWGTDSSDRASRLWSFFESGGVFYVTRHNAPSLGGVFNASIYARTSGTTFDALPSINHATMFPGASTPPNFGQPSVVQKPTLFGTDNVFIGAYVVEDHQVDPFALYKLPRVSSSGGADFASISSLTHPLSPTAPIPWDMFTDGATFYELWSYTSGSDTVVSVVSSTDLATRSEVFSFIPENVTGVSGQTFARSFTYLSGVWYFGLGSRATSIPTCVGDILKFDTNTSAPIPRFQQVYRSRRAG